MKINTFLILTTGCLLFSSAAISQDAVKATPKAELSIPKTKFNAECTSKGNGRNITYNFSNDSMSTGNVSNNLSRVFSLDFSYGMSMSDKVLSYTYNKFTENPLDGLLTLIDAIPFVTSDTFVVGNSTTKIALKRTYKDEWHGVINILEYKTSTEDSFVTFVFPLKCTGEVTGLDK